MDNKLLELLACPRHRHRMEERAGDLVCPAGCEYPVVQGIPILLRHDVEHTLWVANASLAKARQLRTVPSASSDFCIETIAVSPEERASLVAALRSRTDNVDPVVSYLVGATNGILYRSLAGHLPSYPIPELRLPSARGALFLDIGCNWGRWCVAAAKKGFTPVGIDPSLGAVLAARRICRQLDVNARFIVADARYLPFRAQVFDVAFSYSVLQHFSKDNVRTTLSEMARVLKPGGSSMIQMPNAYGIRSLYHQARRGFRGAHRFDVRYWTPGELKTAFEGLLGPTSLSVDCFFGLGVQDSDEHLLPARHKLVVRASRAARSMSDRLHLLQTFADSLYACSVKRP